MKKGERWFLIDRAVDCYDDIWRCGIARRPNVDPHKEGGEWADGDDFVVAWQPDEDYGTSVEDAKLIVLAPQMAELLEALDSDVLCAMDADTHKEYLKIVNALKERVTP